MSIDILNQVTQLTNSIERYRYEYYILNEPSVPDSYYDQLYQKLLQIEAEHPEFAFTGSPTQSVGSDLASSYSDELKAMINGSKLND